MPSRAITTPTCPDLAREQLADASKMRSTNAGGAIHEPCCTSSSMPRVGFERCRNGSAAHERDAHSGADMGHQRPGTLVSWARPSPYVGDQQHQRHRGRDLHEGAERQGHGRGQLSLRGHQIDRGGDREHHQDVDVTAAHRVEQNDRVQPDHRGGVGRLSLASRGSRASRRTTASPGSRRPRPRGTP